MPSLQGYGEGGIDAANADTMGTDIWIQEGKRVRIMPIWRIIVYVAIGVIIGNLIVVNVYGSWCKFKKKRSKFIFKIICNCGGEIQIKTQKPIYECPKCGDQYWIRLLGNAKRERIVGVYEKVNDNWEQQK